MLAVKPLCAKEKWARTGLSALPDPDVNGPRGAQLQQRANGSPTGGGQAVDKVTRPETMLRGSSAGGRTGAVAAGCAGQGGGGAEAPVLPVPHPARPPAAFRHNATGMNSRPASPSR